MGAKGASQTLGKGGPGHSLAHSFWVYGIPFMLFAATFLLHQQLLVHYYHLQNKCLINADCSTRVQGREQYAGDTVVRWGQGSEAASEHGAGQPPVKPVLAPSEPASAGPNRHLPLQPWVYVGFPLHIILIVFFLTCSGVCFGLAFFIC